jgi:uncharacterized protein YecA (UPF0149 family)
MSTHHAAIERVEFVTETSVAHDTGPPVAALRTPTLKRLLETRRNAVRQAARAHFDGTTRGASSVKVGRNDPCPCGSGKKHKKYCQRANA